MDPHIYIWEVSGQKRYLFLNSNYSDHFTIHGTKTEGYVIQNKDKNKQIPVLAIIAPY